MKFLTDSGAVQFQRNGVTLKGKACPDQLEVTKTGNVGGQLTPRRRAPPGIGLKSMQTRHIFGNGLDLGLGHAESDTGHDFTVVIARAVLKVH